jgi:hypothetical protein
MYRTVYLIAQKGYLMVLVRAVLGILCHTGLGTHNATKMPSHPTK